MRESDLPSPGFGSKSWHLRRISANAIGLLQGVAKNYANGIHPDASVLAAFFTACATAATSLTKLFPTTSTFTTAGSVSKVIVGQTLATAFTKGGSAGAVTYVSSDTARATVDASGVITGVAVRGETGTVTITATLAETATYQPRTLSVGLRVTAS